MKRSVFFIVASVISTLFGLMLFFNAPNMSESIGLTPKLELILIVRSEGATMLALGLIYFLVRNHQENKTLRALLVFNIVVNSLQFFSALYGVFEGVDLLTVLPGEIAHLFIGIGSVFYLMKLKLNK